MAYFSTFFDLQAPKRYARAIRLIKKCHVFVKKCHVIPLARPYEHLAYFRQKDRTLSPFLRGFSDPMNNLKTYKTKEQNKALHRTSHKVRRPVNADVGIINAAYK